MLDLLLIIFCVLGAALLLYGRFWARGWFPILRAVLLRVFIVIAGAILLWKIGSGYSYIGVLLDALARTPAAPLKDYSASIQGLNQVAHLHNLSLWAALMATGLAAELGRVRQHTPVAASA